MTKSIISSFICTLLSAFPLSAHGEDFSITVKNNLQQTRNEMIEIPQSEFPRTDFIITDEYGGEIPWQRTYDGKIIFPASIGPNSESVFKILKGKPARVDKKCHVAFYPERIDDLAWENDFSAYRAYGPASNGEMAGYDVFTKSTSRPVVPERYFKELIQKVSYHTDHGDGMDQYDVGPTLGAGGFAPIGTNGELILPGAFSSWKILDNGPLRLTFELTYEYSGIKDTRTITLDAGTPFNHATHRLEGADVDSVAVGIVLHKPDLNTHATGKGFVAYSDPTSSPSKGNGRIFIGVITPEVGKTSYKPLAAPVKSAAGHLIVEIPYSKEKDTEYFFGSSWSKGKTTTFIEWLCKIEDFRRCLESPVEIKITK